MNKQPPPADFDDNPEWTKETTARALAADQNHAPHVVAALVRKPGRPVGWTKADKKAQIALRVDADVLAAYKAGGPGWQTRMNEELRRGIARRAKRQG